MFPSREKQIMTLLKDRQNLYVASFRQESPLQDMSPLVNKLSIQEVNPSYKRNFFPRFVSDIDHSIFTTNTKYIDRVKTDILNTQIH
jgi:hypothetical protein